MQINLCINLSHRELGLLSLHCHRNSCYPLHKTVRTTIKIIRDTRNRERGRVEERRGKLCKLTTPNKSQGPLLSLEEVTAEDDVVPFMMRMSQMICPMTQAASRAAKVHTRIKIT